MSMLVTKSQSLSNSFNGILIFLSQKVGRAGCIGTGVMANKVAPLHPLFIDILYFKICKIIPPCNS